MYRSDTCTTSNGRCWEGGGCWVGDGQGVNIKSLRSAQFHCEYKTALKNSLFGRVVTKGGWGAGDGGGVWEVGASRCNLFHIEWINNKVRLYGAENYIQDPTINHHGKEYFKKECIHIYVYLYVSLNHFAVQQKLTQHYKAIIHQLKSTFKKRIKINNFHKTQKRKKNDCHTDKSC